jgi:ribonucleoside-diphosphate reductase alpha chain
MQPATESAFPVIKDKAFPEMDAPVQRETRYVDYKVIRRNGAVVGFEPGKISVAMTKAFIAVNGGQGAASARVRELVARLTEAVVGALVRRQPQGGTFHIEDIQDQVELALMRFGEHDVARKYVLYREERARERARAREAQAQQAPQVVNVNDGGKLRPLDLGALTALVNEACVGLQDAVDPSLILQNILRDVYEGVSMEEVRKCTVLAARALIEKDPAYSYVTRCATAPCTSAMPSTVRASSRRGWPPAFWTIGCPSSTCAASARRWTQTATSSSATLVSRRFTTATSCTSRASGSNCPRPSSCGWPWVCP